MNHISGFLHRVVEIGHTVGTTAAAVPQALASLQERVNTVAINALHEGFKVFQGVKHLWNLGPVQTTKNAAKTCWAATQVLRKPELVLQQLPNAANVIRYGSLTCSVYKDMGGQCIPFNLLDPANLNLLADGTELTVMCSSPEKVTKKQVLDFVSKLTQLISVGLKPMIDQQTTNTIAFKGLELATGALSIASTAVTLYVYRNEIKDAALKALEICEKINNGLDTIDQDMADADMTLEEMEQAGFFGPSVTQTASSVQTGPPVQEKEGELVKDKKEVKKTGISNPVQKLSDEEQKEIDRAVKQLDDFWFFDSLPPLPPSLPPQS